MSKPKRPPSIVAGNNYPSRSHQRRFKALKKLTLRPMAYLIDRVIGLGLTQAEANPKAVD